MVRTIDPDKLRVKLTAKGCILDTVLLEQSMSKPHQNIISIFKILK